MAKYTLPETMNAVGFDTPGGPEVLSSRRCSLPAVGKLDVLIQVAYAGVNRPDCIQRAGNYPAPPGASPLPGLEVAGEVVAIGEGVPNAMMGKRVAALTPGGGYAEYCAAPWDHCLPVPKEMSWREACAIPETLFTVWHNVFELGNLSSGQTLLVHGGSSGIGTMALMLANSIGAKAIATCGNARKVEAAYEHGADLAINYQDVDFVDEVESFTLGRGVDVVLDMVSGDYVPRNLRCLAVGGKHVTIAVLGGPVTELNMAYLMMRRLTLTGSTLRPRSNAFKAELCQKITDKAWPLFVSGRLKPSIDSVFALDRAAMAHKKMESGQHIGKIVLQVGQE